MVRQNSGINILTFIVFLLSIVKRPWYCLCECYFLSFEILCLLFSSLPKRPCQQFVQSEFHPFLPFTPTGKRMKFRLQFVSLFPRPTAQLKVKIDSVLWNTTVKIAGNETFFCPKIICVLIKSKLRSSGVCKILTFCVHSEFSFLLILNRSEISCPPGYSTCSKSDRLLCYVTFSGHVISTPLVVENLKFLQETSKQN